MKTFKDFNAAKKERDKLQKQVDHTNGILNRFPRTSIGLTQSDVKNTPKYKKAKADFDKAFKALQNFNVGFVKHFKAEIRADRKFK